MHRVPRTGFGDQPPRSSWIIHPLSRDKRPLVLRFFAMPADICLCKQMNSAPGLAHPCTTTLLLLAPMTRPASTTAVCLRTPRRPPVGPRRAGRGTRAASRTPAQLSSRPTPSPFRPINSPSMPTVLTVPRRSAVPGNGRNSSPTPKQPAPTACRCSTQVLHLRRPSENF